MAIETFEGLTDSSIKLAIGGFENQFKEIQLIMSNTGDVKVVLITGALSDIGRATAQASLCLGFSIRSRYGDVRPCEFPCAF